jgi:hypothetical protein
MSPYIRKLEYYFNEWAATLSENEQREAVRVFAKFTDWLRKIR